LRDQLGAERLSILYVVPPEVYFAEYYSPDVYYSPETIKSPEIVPDWLSKLGAQTPGSEVVLIDGASAYPPAEVVRWVRDEHVDLLVAASHRGIFHRMALGGFASYVAYHAECPVVLVPPRVPA
jgi:nucleotide-binding universal stress UspA family protein